MTCSACPAHLLAIRYCRQAAPKQSLPMSQSGATRLGLITRSGSEAFARGVARSWYHWRLRRTQTHTIRVQRAKAKGLPQQKARRHTPALTSSAKVYRMKLSDVRHKGCGENHDYCCLCSCGCRSIAQLCAGLMLNKVLKPGVAPCIGAMSATASDRLDRLTASVVIPYGRPVLSTDGSNSCRQPSRQQQRH